MRMWYKIISWMTTVSWMKKRYRLLNKKKERYLNNNKDIFLHKNMLWNNKSTLINKRVTKKK